MINTNYSDILVETAEVCRKAGAFQLLHFGKIESGQIEDKGLNQLVSFVDIETEKILVAELSVLFPEAGFVTEESTIEPNRDKEFLWIIDPLDGTTNFLHGIPAFSVSVALVQNNIPILGVVYIPVWNEMFTAEKGKGAFLNGNAISVTQTAKLSQTLIATGFPYYEFDYMEPYLAVLRNLMKNTHGLRRMGSAAIDLAYTACGKFDAFFELGLHAWDVAAGILLVKEAGGNVSDFKGHNDFLFGKSIIAGNKVVFSEFTTEIRKHFP